MHLNSEICIKNRFCLVYYAYACASVSVFCVHDTYLYKFPRIYLKFIYLEQYRKMIKRQTSQVGIFPWTVSSPSHFSCGTLVHATWHRLSPSTFSFSGNGDGAGELITALVTPKTLRANNRWGTWDFVFNCCWPMELSE